METKDRMMGDSKYEQVVRANVAVHGKLASMYESTEPHFRPENVAVVDRRLQKLATETGGTRMLDLGCGTGFMISIGKRHFREIHGVDATQEMLNRVDTTGPATVRLFLGDTGAFPVAEGTFDVVTAYSFLHHLYEIEPTLRTAYRALKKGGRFYADLEPNYYFWEAVTALPRAGEYDPIVKREIEEVAHKDEEMEQRFGISREVFNDAEYGKSVAGGFTEEALREALLRIGFSGVEVSYYWFLGQATLINDPSYGEREARFRFAEVTDGILHRISPLSRGLYKYIGFVARR